MPVNMPVFLPGDTPPVDDMSFSFAFPFDINDDGGLSVRRRCKVLVCILLGLRFIIRCRCVTRSRSSTPSARTLSACLLSRREQHHEAPQSAVETGGRLPSSSQLDC